PSWSSWLDASRTCHQSEHTNALPPPSFPTRRSSDLASHARERGANSSCFRVGHCQARTLARARNEVFRGRPALVRGRRPVVRGRDRKSTRLNSSHVEISYAVFCLKKKTRRNRKSTRH